MAQKLDKKFTKKFELKRQPIFILLKENLRQLSVRTYLKVEFSGQIFCADSMPFTEFFETLS